MNDIAKAPIYSLNKYISLDLKKAKSLDNDYFHKINFIKKKSSRKFALFFDTIQTSSSCLDFGILMRSPKLLKRFLKLNLIFFLTRYFNKI